MRFIYHLGVHKTGTKLLQANLRANHHLLLSQGIWCLNSGWPDGLERIRNKLRRFQNPSRTPLPEDTMRELNRRIVRRASNAGAHTVLISEENFLGNPIHRELLWRPEPARFYPVADRCLPVLTHDIDAADIRIVLYTRELGGLLRGHYSEALRAVQTGDSFAEFLDRADLPDFRFDALLWRLEAALPDADFLLRRFETIHDGAATFVRDFLELCGADPTGARLETSETNAGLDAGQAAALRRIHRALRVAGDRDAVRARARAVLEGARDPGNPIRIPESHRARIAAAMQGDISLPPREVVPGIALPRAAAG